MRTNTNDLPTVIGELLASAEASRAADKPRVYFAPAGERLDGQLEGESADAFCERVHGRLHEIAQDLSDALYWFDAAIAPSQMARVGNLHELLIDAIDGKPDGTTHAERERELAVLFPRPPAEAGNANPS